jgi:two-component system nitrate/nitrite response regulator NarL
MRIILADHHEQPRWAIKTLLDEQSEFTLIGTVEEAQSLLKLAEKELPDLVLVDDQLPGVYIEDLISRLHALKPKPSVIVMSSDSENSRKLLKAGADAFVSKGDQADWLLEILYKYENLSRVGNGK